MELLTPEYKTPKFLYQNSFYRNEVDRDYLDSLDIRLVTICPKLSYAYAVLVRTGKLVRFPEGEAAIAKSLWESYQYAKVILKSRFELAEPMIAQNALYSLVYAVHVLKGRFLLGEQYMARYKVTECHQVADYLEHFNLSFEELQQ